MTIAFANASVRGRFTAAPATRLIHRGVMAPGPVGSSVAGRVGAYAAPATAAADRTGAAAEQKRQPGAAMARVRSAVLRALQVMEDVNGVTVVEGIAVVATLAFATEVLLAVFGISINVP